MKENYQVYEKDTQCIVVYGITKSYAKNLTKGVSNLGITKIKTNKILRIKNWLFTSINNQPSSILANAFGIFIISWLLVMIFS